MCLCSEGEAIFVVKSLSPNERNKEPKNGVQSEFIAHELPPFPRDTYFGAGHVFAPFLARLTL